MEKTIIIDGKEIRFKTNGATPLRYKAQFGRDYFKDIAWIMAKTADSSIPEPITWLEQFDEFPMADVIPELQDMLLTSIQTTKKN